MNPNLLPADDFPEPWMRWNGAVRETQPGELLPASPDPAVGKNAGWYAFGAVLASAVLGLVLAQWWRA